MTTLLPVGRGEREEEEPAAAAAAAVEKLQEGEVEAGLLRTVPREAGVAAVRGETTYPIRSPSGGVWGLIPDCCDDFFPVIFASYTYVRRLPVEFVKIPRVGAVARIVVVLYGFSWLVLRDAVREALRACRRRLGRVVPLPY